VAGGVGYFLLVLLTDEPLKLGVRRALSLFFPVLAKGSQNIAL
jgi:hypothetical protein